MSKNQFPPSAGWINAKFTLFKGKVITEHDLKNLVSENRPDSIEVGHIDVSRNPVCIIYREIRPCSCGNRREKSWHLACTSCWAMIPKPLQDEVYHQYKTAQGSDAHIIAVRRCYEAIRAARVQQASNS